MRAAMVAILTVGLWAATGALPAHAARPQRGASRGPNKNEAEGRKHARKANQLADVNKCKAAIPEYTKAIRLLKDPTLLFNRGECYRRTGEAAKAIADYRKFLVQLPAAPNRGQVENQIAALEKKPARTVVALVPAAPVAPVASPPVAPVATAKPPAEPPSLPPPPPPPPVPAPSPPPAPVAEERPPAPPEAVPERERAPPSLPPAPAPVETPGPMALVNTKPASGTDTGGQSGSSYWWLWVVGAVVLAGAGAGTYFALKQGGTDIPPSMLGNYKF